MINEIFNGFYLKGVQTIRDENLRLRLCSLSGGSTNSMVVWSVKGYGLAKSATNAVYVLTRDKWVDLPIQRLEYGSKADNFSTMKTHWMFHSFLYGGAADIVKKSVNYRWCGETRYLTATFQMMLCNRKIRKIKLWHTEEKVAQLPPLNEILPDTPDWTFVETPIHDVGYAAYPFFSKDFTFTNKIKQGTDFVVAHLVEGQGLKRWYGWMKDITSNNAINSIHGKSFDVRAMRIELVDPTHGEDKTPFILDGDEFMGASKFQITFEESFVKQSC